MGTSGLVFVSVFLLVALQSLQAAKHPFGNEVVTNLHFYLHDTLSGKNPTAVPVAHANNTGSPDDPAPFGTVFAIDDLLTEGPELDSAVVGNAQGLYASSGQDKLSLVMAEDFGFTAGPYNWSSFSVITRNPVTEPVRELAVVGGRGKFRMARGFAHLRTYFLNTTTGDAIIEYNVTLLHFDRVVDGVSVSSMKKLLHG